MRHGQIRDEGEIPPGGSRMCGKKRTCGRAFLDLWQWLDLQANFQKCGSERTSVDVGGWLQVARHSLQVGNCWYTLAGHPNFPKGIRIHGPDKVGASGPDMIGNLRSQRLWEADGRIVPN